MTPIIAGLRIDVDTLRGTRLGVPNLVRLLDRAGIQASFFFSVGPDNMGRHLWRLSRPRFLMKMLRTKAASLYGWDILWKGTLWPGPIIGQHCAAQIKLAADNGHEIGLHAWDHHRWQTRVATMDQATVTRELRRGWEQLATIIGRPPDCAAAPAWRITDAALAAREEFPCRYNSDCRGSSPFYPLVNGRQLSQLQIPTTLPTYDELIGGTITPATYNDHLLDLFRPGLLNVLTIHAEAEGLNCQDLFRAFLAKAKERGVSFAPLGTLATAAQDAPAARIDRDTLPGREGWLACQQEIIDLP
jgi:undecaprenyl phosphate-alpha-L-ara4FN deformylase